MIKGIPGDGLSMRTEYQRIMETLVVALLHHLLYQAHGEYWPAGQLGGKLKTAFHEVIVVCHLVDQANTICLLRGHWFARVLHPQGVRHPDQPRQQPGASVARHEAVPDEGLTEPCALGRNPEVAEESDTAAKTVGSPVNGRNRWLLQIIKQPHYFRAHAAVRVLPLRVEGVELFPWRPLFVGPVLARVLAL